MAGLKYFARGVDYPDLVAQATFDGLVRTWSISSFELLAEFPTVFSPVLGRIALCRTEDGPVVVAGGWPGEGLAAYAGASGAVLWHRRDLPEALAVSPAGAGTVAVCFKRAPMRVLDVATGAAVAELPGVRDYRQSPYDPVGIAQFDGSAGIIASATWTRQAKLPIRGWTIAEVAFAPGSCLVTDVSHADSAVPTSILAISPTGRERWRYELGANLNAPWLSWHGATQTWLGIVWDVNRSSPDELHRWSDEGRLLAREPLTGHAEYLFLPGGAKLVAEDVVIDPLTLAILGHLPGPG